MKTLPPFKKAKEFWITNISNKAISLADLGIHIYPFRSVNLLDSNHYRHITEKQLINSAKSGSLFVKSKYVVVRKVHPEHQRRQLFLCKKCYIPNATTFCQ